MELINDILKSSTILQPTPLDLQNLLDKLKYQWALRLELATHRLRYWRQLAKSCSEEMKPLVLVQIDESEETFKISLERYDGIRGKNTEEFLKQEIDQISKILKQQLALSAEDLARKNEQLNHIKNDTEKFGFLDKVYGDEEAVDTDALELYITKAKANHEMLLENVADWEMLSLEDKTRYVYIKNSSEATFNFADNVVDEFKKSST